MFLTFCMEVWGVSFLILDLSKSDLKDIKIIADYHKYGARFCNIYDFL